MRWLDLFEANMAPHGMYAYHATFERNLPGIRQHGLVMNEEPNWDFTRTGRLYASDHDGADWYSQELGGAFEQRMVIIRFPMPANTTPDELGNHGDFWFRENIAPESIEVESEPGGRFIPISEYQMALTEVSYEPQYPYRPEVAVPFMDKAFSNGKKAGLEKLGNIDEYTVMATPEKNGMMEFFLVKNGNPVGEITLTSARGNGERWVSSSFVRPECRGVGLRFYKFIIQQGYMLRSGRTHTEDARKLWTKLALDPEIDVRMNYDKEVTTAEDVAMAYESQLYFLTAKKAGLTEDAKPRFKTKAPDEEWRERVRKWQHTDDTICDDPKSEAIKRKLLAIGGWAVCGLDDPDRDVIMARGQLWSGRGAYFMKGRPSNCHGNVCALWEENRDTVQICTGWALSPDGMWRIHSWGLHQGKPVETTVKRTAYFGFVMTDEEASDFADSNI